MALVLIRLLRCLRMNQSRLDLVGKILVRPAVRYASGDTSENIPSSFVSIVAPIKPHEVAKFSDSELQCFPATTSIFLWGRVLSQSHNYAELWLFFAMSIDHGSALNSAQILLIWVALIDFPRLFLISFAKSSAMTSMFLAVLDFSSSMSR